MERYTCPRELLAVVESALAAEGYVVAPLQRAVGGSRVTVMTRGASVIALQEEMGRELAAINVYEGDEVGPPAVLEQLPRLIWPAGRRRG